jgi:hypothetical protein
MSKKKSLTAKNLKDELWDVLQDVRKGKIEPVEAEAVASQSREIIRVLRVQQSIIKQANEKITNEMLDFVTKTEG